LNIFVSNVFFYLENYEFWNFSLRKVIHFCVIWSMDALYMHDKEIYNKK
jgi:hypothetical protein